MDHDQRGMRGRGGYNQRGRGRGDGRPERSPSFNNPNNSSNNSSGVNNSNVSTDKAADAGFNTAEVVRFTKERWNAATNACNDSSIPESARLTAGRCGEATPNFHSRQQWEIFSRVWRLLERGL
eukprot:jgi/Chlat1/8058/Chrsp73S07532